MGQRGQGCQFGGKSLDTFDVVIFGELDRPAVLEALEIRDRGLDLDTGAQRRAPLLRLAAACGARRQDVEILRAAGTGFTHASLAELYRKLTPLITKTKPVDAKVPNEANTTWVKPKLVAEVQFTEWTEAGEMRHPVFLGLRTDKQATEVIRERPKPLRETRPASRPGAVDRGQGAPPLCIQVRP